MDTALVIHFTRPYPGRETLAFEAFQDAMTFFGKLATDGHCELPVAYMGTSGGGMMVIHGERTKLHELAHGEEFNRLYLKAGFTNDGLTFEFMAAGEGAVIEMGDWAKLGVELGLMEVPV
jgi:hypothetical protein